MEQVQNFKLYDITYRMKCQRLSQQIFDVSENLKYNLLLLIHVTIIAF